MVRNASGGFSNAPSRTKKLNQSGPERVQPPREWTVQRRLEYIAWADRAVYRSPQGHGRRSCGALLRSNGGNQRSFWHKLEADHTSVGDVRVRLSSDPRFAFGRLFHHESKFHCRLQSIVNAEATTRRAPTEADAPLSFLSKLNLEPFHSHLLGPHASTRPKSKPQQTPAPTAPAHAVPQTPLAPAIRPFKSST
jgi:hypothetical protein